MLEQHVNYCVRAEARITTLVGKSTWNMGLRYQ